MDGRFRLAHCQLVWDLIKLYTEGIPSAMKAIKADQLKGALKRLKAVTDKYSSLPSEEGTYQPSRRSRDPGNRPTQGHDAIKAMVGPREKDNERLRRFTEGLAPKEGLVSAPGWIPAVSIATLTHADWVDDRVIDGYLALVCHHGNGHFKALKEGNSSEREGSPRFHAWPVFLSHGVIGFGSNWPPPYYPSARI